MARLQRILNNSARLIFRKRRSEHVRPMLISLHWLPIKQRTEYKWATLAFRYFEGTLLPYLSHCLSSYTPHRSVPSIIFWQTAPWPTGHWKSACARSFQYQAPFVWNSCSGTNPILSSKRTSSALSSVVVILMYAFIVLVCAFFFFFFFFWLSSGCWC